jgi:HK97 family phage prohead protease/HK97 family phage major capsid protein
MRVIFVSNGFMMGYKSNKDNEMQYKASLASIERKEAGDDGVLHIKAYALAFNNVDSWGDIIAPGACDEFLKSENFGRMALCYQHDINEVIGVITDAGVDEKGMWIEADVLPTTTGKNVQVLMKAGAVKEFSIGYYADEYHYEKKDGYQYDIRVLDAITVIEVSPVTRAANPQAVLIDAKNDNNDNPIKKETMQETKIQELEQSLTTAQAEAKAAKAAADAMKADLESAKENATKQSQEIDNLDKSVKAQQQTIEGLRKMINEAPKTFRKAMRDALESKKEEIAQFIKDGKGTFNVEFKVGTSSLTPAATNHMAYGVAQDPTIHSVPVLGNAFLLAFGTKPLDAARISWIEASTEKNVGYVEELAENNNKSEVTFVEKQRQAAKIATYMEISSEVENWFEVLYDFCVNEGERLILSDLDGKVWNGDGNDGTAPRHIYGLKGVATPFAKLGAYENAGEADVIFDAIAQIRKAGYNADVALVSYATEAILKGAKDKSGNPIYDAVKATIGQVQIIPSDKLGDAEMFIADSYCADIYTANFYELEFSRKASHDAWRVDYRRRAQVKVATPKAKGLVYVANKATAIEAITKA